MKSKACEAVQEPFQPAGAAHYADVRLDWRSGPGGRLESETERCQEPDDPYWKQVRYLFLQMWGLKAPARDLQPLQDYGID